MVFMACCRDESQVSKGNFDLAFPDTSCKQRLDLLSECRCLAGLKV